MEEAISIQALAEHPEVLPMLQEWFEAEWPDHYGEAGPGDALLDLESYARGDVLPSGVVAFTGDRVCGVAALKSESIRSHAHLSPWAAAGYVQPALRGRGIGAMLLQELEALARRLGFEHIYCATETSESLLTRGGWRLMERTEEGGRPLAIFTKRLGQSP
jgi:GNAT superfamily N-acetyltransferase